MTLCAAHPESKPLANNPTPFPLARPDRTKLLHRCFCWPPTWVHGNECNWRARHQRVEIAPPTSHEGIGPAQQPRARSRRKAATLLLKAGVGFHQNHLVPSPTTGDFLYYQEKASTIARTTVRARRHRHQVGKAVETAAAAAAMAKGPTGGHNTTAVLARYRCPRLLLQGCHECNGTSSCPRSARRCRPKRHLLSPRPSSTGIVPPGWDD